LQGSFPLESSSGASLVQNMPEHANVIFVFQMAQEVGKHGGDWHRLYTGVEKVNAVPAGKPLSHYEMASGLLVPLYVPRATEEVLFGAMGVTLQTAREV
jgi:hypothetical protein